MSEVNGADLIPSATAGWSALLLAVRKSPEGGFDVQYRCSSPLNLHGEAIANVGHMTIKSRQGLEDELRRMVRLLLTGE